MAEAIASGSQVRLHFRLRLADGAEVDTSYGAEPLLVTLGSGDLVDGLEQRLVGLKPGDRRQFEVPALEAFGAIEEGTVSTLSRSDFPDDVELAPGAVIAFETPQGEEVPGTILDVGESEVLVDFSHPLAGHDLIFEVEILEAAPGT